MNKLKVRLNTFETNSSSAHTMVILDEPNIVGDDEINEVIENKCKNNKDCKNKDETFYFPIDSSNCYGTGFEILENWEDKLNYLVASLKSNYEEDIISFNCNQLVNHAESTGYCRQWRTYWQQYSNVRNK